MGAGGLKAGCWNHLKSPSVMSLAGDGVAGLGTSLGLWAETPTCGFFMCLGFLTTWWLDSKGKHLKGEPGGS